MKELKITDPVHRDLFSQKQEWISLIEEHPRMSNHQYVLPFFGKVKNEQAGYLAYKHNDNHLRQFNA